MNTKTSVDIRVTRGFSTTAERVFDAWLNPEMIGIWMFGSAVRDEEVVRITTDPQVGGSFSFLVRRQGEEIDHVGEYLEIERPRRLAFTWGIGQTERSRVIIDIVTQKTGCELTLMHELPPDWADYASRTEAAWRKMLDALANALEANKQTQKKGSV